MRQNSTKANNLHLMHFCSQAYTLQSTTFPSYMPNYLSSCISLHCCKNSDMLKFDTPQRNPTSNYKIHKLHLTCSSSLTFFPSEIDNKTNSSLNERQVVANNLEITSWAHENLAYQNDKSQPQSSESSLEHIETENEPSVTIPPECKACSRWSQSHSCSRGATTSIFGVWYICNC